MRQRKTKKKDRKALQNQHWHPFTDPFSAYLAGDFAAMYDLQMREDYGDEWEEQMMNEYISLDNVVNEEEEDTDQCPVVESQPEEHEGCKATAFLEAEIPF